MEEPIATYRESRLELRRRFELYPDHVRITGSGWSLGRFDAVLPLSVLRPEPSRQWVRGRPFRWGLLALFCAVGWAAPAVASAGPEALLLPRVFAVSGSLAWIGLLAVLAVVRPVEFVRFQSGAGIAALDVGRVGPDAEEFDEFVELLTKCIRGASAEAKPGTAPDPAT